MLVAVLWEGRGNESENASALFGHGWGDNAVAIAVSQLVNE